MFKDNFRIDIKNYIKEHKSKILASRQSQGDLHIIGDHVRTFNFGKLYVFRYFTPDEEIYDTNPIILYLGRSDDNNYLGFNIHYMPHHIRVNFLADIRRSFQNVIKYEIEKLNPPKRQRSLAGFNYNNLKAAYHNKYNIK